MCRLLPIDILVVVGVFRVGFVCFELFGFVRLNLVDLNGNFLGF